MKNEIKSVRLLSCRTWLCLNTFCIVLRFWYYSTSGSRRPSIASIHSNASSSRSYSARRFERENMQREQRQLQLQMQMQMQQDNLKPGAAPTPSPKTPVSTDELLPSVSEVREVREGDQCTCLSKPLALYMHYIVFVLSKCGVTKSTGLIHTCGMFPLALTAYCMWFVILQISFCHC